VMLSLPSFLVFSHIGFLTLSSELTGEEWLYYALYEHCGQLGLVIMLKNTA